MQITIEKKDYSLYFGWDFLENVNESLGIEMEVGGQKINTRSAGLNFLQSGLSQYDPITLLKGLKAALATNEQKPSNKALKKWIQELLVDDPKKYKEFIDELSAEIKKEPMLQALIKITQ